MAHRFLPSAIKQFKYYRLLGDKTMDRLSDAQLLWSPGTESNSIGVIVGHMHGNMLSRWTNFLTEDGEKTWRKRDTEFEERLQNKQEILAAWNQGWDCVMQAVSLLTEQDLDQTVYIRNQGHTVAEAINRQLCHYAYHVGQITYLGKMQLGQAWQSLSIPKGASKTYNKEKFSKPVSESHFTDEYLEKDGQ